jgi:hypothetical protein
MGPDAKGSHSDQRRIKKLPWVIGGGNILTSAAKTHLTCAAHRGSDPRRSAS